MSCVVENDNVPARNLERLRKETLTMSFLAHGIGTGRKNETLEPSAPQKVPNCHKCTEVQAYTPRKLRRMWGNLPALGITGTDNF